MRYYSGDDGDLLHDSGADDECDEYGDDFRLRKTVFFHSHLKISGKDEMVCSSDTFPRLLSVWVRRPQGVVFGSDLLPNIFP